MVHKQIDKGNCVKNKRPMEKDVKDTEYDNNSVIL